MLRRRRVYPLLLPHTKAVDLYQAGSLSLADVATHPAHRTPTRWLGQANPVNPDSKVIQPNAENRGMITPVNEAVELQRGDVIVLCTSEVPHILEDEQQLYKIVVARRPNKSVGRLLKYIQKHRYNLEHDTQVIVLALPTVGQWVKFSLLRFAEISGWAVRILFLLVLIGGLASYVRMRPVEPSSASANGRNSSAYIATNNVVLTEPASNVAELQTRAVYPPTPGLLLLTDTPRSQSLAFAAEPTQAVVVSSSPLTSVITSTPTGISNGFAIAAPELLQPKLAPARGQLLLFSWRWIGALQQGWGFEVRIWQGNNPHNSPHDARIYNKELIPLANEEYNLLLRVPDVVGSYAWAVAVARLDPYERIGPESAPGELTIGKVCRTVDKPGSTVPDRVCD